MKVYSKVLTADDIWAASRGIDGVCIDDSNVRSFRPRAGGNGYEFYLEGYAFHHLRRRNNRDGYAATWDEWGIVIARLYEIDPDARISWYTSRANFMEETARYIPRGMKAPWLKQVAA